ncbi:MAG: large-conductance mechanosensitive channel protein MscL [Planctomycetota bacterium]
MGIIKEFKEFILKGNMIDLAVGIVIGAAFSTVVKSLVDNIVMPPVGALMGGIDFSKYEYTVIDAVKAGEENIYGVVADMDIDAVTIKYGLFIGDIIYLLIVGLAIFLVVKGINSMKRKAEEAPKEEPTPADIQLLTEIRDALNK